MSFNKSLPILVLLAAMRTHCLAATGHFEITSDQVAGAIRSAGIAVSANDVALLANVVATSPAPRLTIQSVESWSDHRLRIRCACSSSKECLPFFVSVNGKGADRPVSGNVPPPSHAALPDAAQHNAGVRSGSAATLFIEAEHTQIQIPVICLESGAPGKTIRVTSVDHRRTYLAEVVSDSMLKRRM